jgi:hypothetical protein
LRQAKSGNPDTKAFLIFFSVRPSLEPGWLEGNLDGKFGLVPENYVEFIS